MTSATVVKLTADAAADVLSLVRPGEQLAESLEGKAAQLAKALQARLCVITDGGTGLGIALGGDDDAPPVFVPAFGGIAQVDTTGAGDAAFGGVIASLYAKGFPTDAAGLERMARVAAAAGGACVEVQGGWAGSEACVRACVSSVYTQSRCRSSYNFPILPHTHPHLHTLVLSV